MIKLKKTISLALIISSVLAQSVSAMTATHYSSYYQGRKMANGQRFSQNSNSVATNRYRLGTRLRICYKNRCVTGVVRDKCNCSIDLSKGLFRQLAPLKKGAIPVKVSKI